MDHPVSLLGVFRFTDGLRGIPDQGECVRNVGALGHWGFLLDAIACTGLVYVTVSLIYWVCLILDKAMPWEKNPGNRFIAQGILGFMVGFQLMEFLNRLYVAYGGNDLLYAGHGFTQIPVSFLVSMIVNCYYFGAYFAEKNIKRTLERGGPVAPPPASASEMSDDGARMRKEQQEKLPLITYADGEGILVQHLDIAVVALEGGNLAIYTFSGKCYHDSSYTVDAFFLLLDPNDYYHTSRTTIIHRDTVKGIKPWFTKSLSVILTLAIDVEVIVAERRVADFKKWLSAGSSPPKPRKAIPVPALF